MRRYALVALNVLFFLAIPASASRAQLEHHSAICIEHIGESDQFIPPILLGLSEGDIEWCRSNAYYQDKQIMTFKHIIPTSLMTQLLHEVETTHGEKEAHTIPFGTFAITTPKSKGKQVLILDKAQTLELVARLKGLCKRDELFTQLSEIQERLGKPGGQPERDLLQ